MATSLPPWAGAVAGQGPETAWLALGTVLMGLGALYFGLRGLLVEDPRARRFHAVAALVPAIAFAAYLSMLLGFGVTRVTVVGRGPLDVYWARYADWLVTTPLLLVALGLLAGADRDALFGAVAADAFMIVTGLVAALSRVQLYRYVWWGVSSLAFAFVLYFLIVRLGARARALGPATTRTFGRLRALTVVLWAAYPVWWLLGTGGASLVSLPVETAGFMLLDVLAKLGFGLVLLHSPAITVDPGTAAGPAPTADAAE